MALPIPLFSKLEELLAINLQLCKFYSMRSNKMAGFHEVHSSAQTTLESCFDINLPLCYIWRKRAASRTCHNWEGRQRGLLKQFQEVSQEALITDFGERNKRDIGTMWMMSLFMFMSLAIANICTYH